jgi:hypothetical protein
MIKNFLKGINNYKLFYIYGGAMMNKSNGKARI